MKNFILLIIIVSSVPLLAATIDEQREAKGYGANYQEALSSALLDGVRQVRGLEVGAERILRANIIGSIGALGTVVITGKADISTDIYTKSKGWIKTYKILKVKKPSKSSDQWEVMVLVTVPVYKEAVKNDNRKTIAVLPFEIVPDRILTHSLNLSLNHITTRISDAILTELTQSRKFAVVNRSFDSQFSKERKLLASDKVSPAEASRLGRKLGADFIIIGKINELRFKKGESFYGMSSSKTEIHLDLFYTVIEAATEKVMWADTMIKEYKIGKAGKEDQVISEFVRHLSANITTNILDVIYPIKIMKLAGEQKILLNQGGKRLAKGQIMEVFTAGETITDPDTGMPIKIDGNKVAELEVTLVKPGYSITKFVKGSGNYRKLTVNAITRRAGKESAKPSIPERELTPGSSDKPVSW